MAVEMMVLESTGLGVSTNGGTPIAGWFVDVYNGTS